KTPGRPPLICQSPAGDGGPRPPGDHLLTPTANFPTFQEFPPSCGRVVGDLACRGGSPCCPPRCRMSYPGGSIRPFGGAPHTIVGKTFRRNRGSLITRFGDTGSGEWAIGRARLTIAAAGDKLNR